MPTHLPTPHSLALNEADERVLRRSWFFAAGLLVLVIGTFLGVSFALVSVDQDFMQAIPTM